MMLVKDAEDQVDRSCEKWKKYYTESRRKETPYTRNGEMED